jgi:hypothetical protein
MTEYSPRTAADLIQEAVRVVNWTPDAKHSEQARYDAARAMSSIYAYWTTVALETLRRIDPAAAERVATHIDDDLDWQNACENAWAWHERLTKGEPIDPEGRIFPALTAQTEEN